MGEEAKPTDQGTKQEEKYRNSSTSFGICFSTSMAPAIKVVYGSVCGHHSTQRHSLGQVLPFPKYQAASHLRAFARMIPFERNAPFPSHHLDSSLFYKSQQKCDHMGPWPCPGFLEEWLLLMKCHLLSEVLPAHSI